MKIMLLAAGLAAVAAAGCCVRPGEANRELRLMSYNVYHCQGADKKLDIARTAEAIRRETPASRRIR